MVALAPAESTRAAVGEKGVSYTLAGGGEGPELTGVFTALTAPTQLPSAYVKIMEKTGYAILDGIMQPDDIAEMRVVMAEKEAGLAKPLPEEGRTGLPVRTAIVMHACSSNQQ